jgi:two-component system cell cycle sensor histidine kinase/response regulator CckA
VLAMIAFFYLARRLKGIMRPALVLIGTGFGLIMLDLILRSFFGNGFLYESLPVRTSPFFESLIGYIGQIAGLLLLLFGFYRVNRVAVDLTDRQQFEDERRLITEALAASESRYRRFFHEDPSGNFISTPEGKILACNPAFAKFFGYDSPEEILSVSANKLYDGPHAREEYLRLLRQNRKLLNYREKMRKRDGSDVYLTANINGEFDDEGQLVQIQGYVIDETERVKAQQSLRVSLEQFRVVFEESAVGMMLVNVDMEIIRANRAMCSMLGYSEDEIKEISIRGLTHPEDLTKDLPTLQRLLQGGVASYQIEKRYIAKSGEVIWGLLTTSIVREGDGPPLYGIRVVEDITARKQGERDLERSLSLLRATLDSTADGILVVDRNGHIVSHNARFREMWRIPDYVLETGEDQLALQFVVEQLEDPEGFLKKVQDLYSQPEAEGYDSIRFKDGRVFERYSKPQLIGGKTVGRVWSFRDVTDRELADARLRVSEEKYRTLFEESKDVVFISTPQGRFLDINQAGVELFGFPNKEELLKTDIGRDLYLDPVDRQKTSDLLAEHGYLKDHVSLARRADGQKLILLETTSAVRDEHGKIVAYRGILRDITDQHRLEEHLRQAQKMESVGTLAGGIAHDFNNILGIIQGYLANLEGPVVDPERFARNLDAIRRTVARGTGLVGQLLTFARPAGADLEDVDVNATISDLSRLLADTFPKSIQFDLRLGEPVPLVLADSGQLQQAILNLCLNARDAILEGLDADRPEGILTIETGVVGGRDLRGRFPEADQNRYVRVSVSDTGIGMSDATKSRIFEPFFTTKGPNKGTGLGLAIVYGIVNSHHGFIEVESAPGAGTMVRLFLPTILGSSEAPAAVPDEESTPQGSGETILLVEDEETLLNLLQTLLEENGYRVLLARDGMEAVDLFRHHRPDISLVLSDMGLPKLGGWEVLQRMKELDPNVKCILASGYLDPDLKLQMIKDGAVDFVQKPYVPHLILTRIRNTIDGPGSDGHSH